MIFYTAYDMFFVGRTNVIEFRVTFIVSLLRHNARGRAVRENPGRLLNLYCNTIDNTKRVRIV